MKFWKASCLTLLVSVSFAPAGAFADDRFTCWAPTAAQAAFTADYWTDERRRNAIPAPGLLPESGMPGGDVHSLGGTEVKQAPIKEAPFKFGGKLFFSLGGIDQAASAQFVSDDKIIIGAAHAMWLNGDQASNVVFYPGYDGAPGEAYPIDMASVLTAWTKIPQVPGLAAAAVDYAVMRSTKASTSGKFQLRLAKVPEKTELTLMGYPGRLDGGEYMFMEDPSISVSDATAYEAKPHPMYGGGASGGAWFLPAENKAFEIFSVVSNGSPSNVKGPHFTHETEEMIEYVKGGCK